jgi:hypothetical protein
MRKIASFLRHNENKNGFRFTLLCLQRSEKKVYESGHSIVYYAVKVHDNSGRCHGNAIYLTRFSSKQKALLVPRPRTQNETNNCVPCRTRVSNFQFQLQKEEHRNFHSSLNIIRVIKVRRRKWVGHVACMGEKKNAYRILVGKPEGKT